ncbi:hypothetical protein BU25DRAFT_50767 [Macroventuria anomochaeta]|uniref:Uncharacterized protein n=1 Tax=Macroventuria anomochaeta TaxID=301207 RepID=A0ACB6S0W1_9PLEO|nr:uncharacterized protein BU25DRAFT_50767 [Macroventuria anomochaeta]KAF2627602.1 hypothetical protein BU25DRAFT_50767 [Macroventuria anomochaeta]
MARQLMATKLQLISLCHGYVHHTRDFVRAAHLDSIGMCYAQHVWRALRGRAVPVHVVESLFQIRHNPTELTSSRLLKHRWALFCIAAYMWFVPVAATFPPGALTIAPRPFLSTEQVNALVLNPLLPHMPHISGLGTT